MTKLYHRSYECDGKEGEAEFWAEDDFDAESESDHWQESYCQGHPERYESFEWTGSAYTRE